MKRLLLIGLLSLCACKGDPGREGRRGAPGLNGLNGGTPFTYQGMIRFPDETASQVIPNFNVERGDIVNVYLRWDNGQNVWAQILTNWVGGQSGWYEIQGSTVNIYLVTGVDTEWLINGLRKD